MNRAAWLCLFWLISLLNRPTAAQDGADTVQLTGNLGFVNTAGNTDLTTINVEEEFRYVVGKVGLGQSFGLVYGRTDGETTSSIWQAGLRGEYTLSPRVAVFGVLSFDRNRFAGIARRFEEGVGLLVKLIQQPNDRLEAEAGLSLVQQRSTLGPDNDFASGRAAGKYVHDFAEDTFFQQLVEFFPSLEAGDDLRVETESSLVAPLSRQLSLKVSYVIRYDNLPEPGFEKTDRLLTSGLRSPSRPG